MEKLNFVKIRFNSLLFKNIKIDGIPQIFIIQSFFHQIAFASNASTQASISFSVRFLRRFEMISLIFFMMT